ncbi:hypothetical protein [Streptomyces albogriseolus]|uniref:hypothetical protein n=1 Tax=Streptomyces albogriseolus TaxID=1887 RepID=UPI003460C721
MTSDLTSQMANHCRRCAELEERGRDPDYQGRGMALGLLIWHHWFAHGAQGQRIDGCSRCDYLHSGNLTETPQQADRARIEHRIAHELGIDDSDGPDRLRFADMPHQPLALSALL